MSYFRNCNVIVFALALYSLRLLGYSFIESASQSLFLEVLDFIFLSLCFLDGSLNLLFLIFNSGSETIWKFTSCDSSNDLCQKQCINRNYGIPRGKIDALKAPAATNPVCLCVPKLFNGVYILHESRIVSCL